MSKRARIEHDESVVPENEENRPPEFAEPEEGYHGCAIFNGTAYKFAPSPTVAGATELTIYRGGRHPVFKPDTLRRAHIIHILRDEPHDQVFHDLREHATNMKYFTGNIHWTNCLSWMADRLQGITLVPRNAKPFPPPARIQWTRLASLSLVLNGQVHVPSITAVFRNAPNLRFLAISSDTRSLHAVYPHLLALLNATRPRVFALHLSNAEGISPTRTTAANRKKLQTLATRTGEFRFAVSPRNAYAKSYAVEHQPLGHVHEGTLPHEFGIHEAFAPPQDETSTTM